MSDHLSIREYVIELATEFSVRYHPTPEDAMADMATWLAGDDVVTD